MQKREAERLRGAGAALPSCPPSRLVFRGLRKDVRAVLTGGCALGAGRGRLATPAVGSASATGPPPGPATSRRKRAHPAASPGQLLPPEPSAGRSLRRLRLFGPRQRPQVSCHFSWPSPPPAFAFAFEPVAPAANVMCSPPPCGNPRCGALVSSVVLETFYCGILPAGLCYCFKAWHPQLNALSPGEGADGAASLSVRGAGLSLRKPLCAVSCVDCVDCVRR